ncbi:pyrimidine reductase family protein [Herbiconiux sp. P15]|uniref:pyrimidine reductase family protein n=1 Tax=Herbiconiux liukaitaii TaxID=3342799 RepID=UPI0035BB5B8C
MSDAPIRSLVASTRELRSSDLRELYAPEPRDVPRLRVNFVQSLDGSATVQGLSGGLGGPADKLVFDTLRGLADVVLVGAGTARAEGYGALTVSDEHVAHRRSLGLPDHPAMALVSGRLDLDPASALFAAAPRRPLVFTSRSAPAEARSRLSEVADVIDAGDEHVDPAAVVRHLHTRGLLQTLCEGGPSLFGDLIAADLVDELCLTISPVLEGGSGPRIARAPGDRADPSMPLGFELAHALASGSLLLTRWLRSARDEDGTASA